MENVIKKAKPNMFAGLKSLVNWIVSKTHDEEQLDEIIKKYEFDKTIIKRLYSYIYSSPHLLSYCNKWMNDLFDWNKFELKDFIKSFIYILNTNDFLDSKKFFYIKSSLNKDEQRTQILNLFDKYFQTAFDKKYSQQNIKFFYLLYLNNIITNSDLIEMDKYLNGGKQTLKIEADEVEKTVNIWDREISTTTLVSETIKNNENKSNKIKDFCTKVKNFKLTRSECQSCKLFNNTIVVLDSNCDEPSNVDVAFIALNPGTEEAKADQPLTFSGKSGQFVRDQISKLNKDVKWVIYNTILCSTRNKIEIGSNNEVDDVRKRCDGMIANIKKHFPAKLNILIGDDSAKAFGIEEKISQCSGKLFNDIRAIPVIHPSGMRNLTTQAKAKESWKFIIDTVNNIDNINFNTEIKKEEIKTEISKINTQINETNINHEEPKKKRGRPKKVQNLTPTSEKTSITSDVIQSQQENIMQTIISSNVEEIKSEDEKFLLDVRELDNEVLMIYVNKDGKKIYERKPYELSGYIKDTIYKNCDIITSEVDYVFQMTRFQKNELIKELRKQLSKLKIV